MIFWDNVRFACLYFLYARSLPLASGQVRYRVLLSFFDFISKVGIVNEDLQLSVFMVEYT